MPLFRDAFLAMSTNRLVRALVVGFPLSRRVSRRFVAGETMDEAIRVVKELNERKLVVSLDHLGESVTLEWESREAKNDYVRLLDAVAVNRVSSHVSVKLTQMGLDLSTELCLANMREIVGKAKGLGNFVRIDMEDSHHTQPTLDVFTSLRKEFENLGIVIQSYLYRSEEDMRALLALKANVRLCKGAYKEPAALAFPKKRDVDTNYIKLAKIFLDASSRHGAHLALATHDERIIGWAKEYTGTHAIDRARFEFQMLYGIRSDLQRQLSDEGYTMRVYVPYGTQWYPYFMRRLAERPANAVFMARNLFR